MTSSSQNVATVFATIHIATNHYINVASTYPINTILLHYHFTIYKQITSPLQQFLPQFYKSLQPITSLTYPPITTITILIHHHVINHNITKLSQCTHSYRSHPITSLLFQPIHQSQSLPACCKTFAICCTSPKSA